MITLILSIVFGAIGFACGALWVWIREEDFDSGEPDFNPAGRTLEQKSAGFIHP